MEKLNVAVSPHLKTKDSVSKIMWTVVVSLIPAGIGSVYFFGLHALGIIISSVAGAVLTEALIQKVFLKKPVTITDGSAVVTGILLAFSISPQVPLWLVVVGSAFGIGIAKHCFGGLGWNVFNPAMIGRAFLLASWPALMTRWITSFDAKTTASPLGILKEEGIEALVTYFGNHATMYKSLFLGSVSGSSGETSCLLLLIGAIILFIKGYITWPIPFSFLGTIALLSWVFGGQGLCNGDPLLNILSGGVILGAFFIATDMVTSPTTKIGQLIFGMGAGALVVLIRLKGGYPEGVCYAVLLMNALVPITDRLVKRRPFGMKTTEITGKEKEGR
ncbi:RnfABCDGE type electron transport complex subunit D [bacterium]|nr:RnfABCDGE type electron transport complex subunit D [bacterium]